MNRTNSRTIAGGRPRRRPRWALVCTAVSLVVAGCSDGGDRPAGDAPPASATGSGDPAPGRPTAPYPRTVAHGKRSTEIAARPKRVVVLDAGIADAAIALGVRVVGLPNYSSSGASLPDYLKKAGASVIDPAAFLGDVATPNLEQLAGLRPDVIISTASRHEDIYGTLSMVAPTVLSLKAPAFKDGLRLVGAVMGEEARAEQLIAAYEARAAAIGKAIERATGSRPIASVVRFVDAPTLRLYQVDSYSGTVLADVGLRRPASQQAADKAFVNVSVERIADADADVIFVTTFRDEAGVTDRTRTAFESNPLWGTLAGTKVEVQDAVWMGATGILGAHAILDDLARHFRIDPMR